MRSAAASPTNRLVARHCGDVPLCTLSTETSNSFPAMREAAVAGLATRLLATGQVSKESLRREKIMRVSVDGDADRDCALVDVAVLAGRFVRARALWRPEGISEIFVASASSDAVGLSSVVGLLNPTPRFTPYGLHLHLTDPSEAETALTVPLVPGLVVPVGMAEKRRMQRG